MIVLGVSVAYVNIRGNEIENNCTESCIDHCTKIKCSNNQGDKNEFDFR